MRVLTVAVALLVAAAVSAQDTVPRELWDDVWFLSLLRNEAVQKELKMTPEQIEKATAASKDLTQKLSDMMAVTDREIRPGLPPVDRIKARIKIAAGLEKEFQKEAERILKPDQIKRAWQIEVQALGLSAFRDPDVIKELKLTDDQRKAVAEVFTSYDRESEALMRAAFADGVNHEKIKELGKKLDGVHKKEFDALLAKLTGGQKKVWKEEIVGEPFDLAKLAPAFLRKSG